MATRLCAGARRASTTRPRFSPTPPMPYVAPTHPLHSPFPRTSWRVGSALVWSVTLALGSACDAASNPAADPAPDSTDDVVADAPEPNADARDDAHGSEDAPTNGSDDPAAPRDTSPDDGAVPTDAENDEDAPDVPGPDAPDTAAPDAPPSPPPCRVEPVTACPDPAPTYVDTIAPIFAQHCTTCHGNPATGNWPLDTWEHVADWRDSIRASMLDCSMPPTDSVHAMVDAERVAILAWIRCGMPRTAP